VLQQYSTSVELGLDSNQALKRQEQYGRNCVSKPPNNWIKKLISYFFGGFCTLLWIASIICW
jgi:sodium/potassium-transporting ATPase subunit alpha